MMEREGIIASPELWGGRVAGPPLDKTWRTDTEEGNRWIPILAG